MKKIYTLPFGTSITVDNYGDNGNVSGSIKSNILMQLSPDESDPLEPKNIAAIAATDAIESLLLGLACQGINISDERFAIALSSSIESIVQHLDDYGTPVIKQG